MSSPVKVWLPVLLTFAVVLNAAAKRNFRERSPQPPVVTVTAMPWAVTNAPYRAILQLDTLPNVPAAGVAIETPDFGQLKPDLSDVVLTDGAGEIQPLNTLQLRGGKDALLLAKELKPGATYALYFGGDVARERKPWTPRALSLLLETRRLPGGAKFGNGREIRETWERAQPVDGVGFVRQISHGENPFGSSQQFATHYTGYLLTEHLRQLRLYTLSSDASFVFVNGQCVLSTPGLHGAHATATKTPLATVKCNSPLTRIDYYHVKAGSDHPPGMALGWIDDTPETRREIKHHGYEIIPANAWVHSGTAKILRFEGRDNRPVPAPQVNIASYIGYANAWFYDVTLTAPPLPADWTAEWQFSDGAIRSGSTLTRVLVTDSPQTTATLRLKRGLETITGILQLDFSSTIPEASINRPSDVKRYAALLAQDDLSRLPPSVIQAAWTLLTDFGTVEQIGRVADVVLQKFPDNNTALWAQAQEMRLRWLAQTNLKAALAELRNLPPATRQKHARQFDDLELDLLIYGLHDLSAAARVQVIAGTPLRTRIRLGDLCRLAGKIPQAVEQYRAAQQLTADDSQGRKLPAQDRAFSMTVTTALAHNDRLEAGRQLAEWELLHPLAKLTTDFLLLRARTLIAWSCWRDGLAELDSFQTVNPENPFQIEADFIRAQALFALGQPDTARKLWSDIAKNYPKHDLAPAAAELAKQP